jgi:hypothetical protein
LEGTGKGSEGFSRVTKPVRVRVRGLAILAMLYRNTEVDDNYLLCSNRIPAYQQLILLSIHHIQSKSLLDVGIIDQAEETPRANAHKCTSRLNIQAAADIGKHKSSTRENTFYINGSSLKVHKYDILKQINLNMLTWN